MDSFFQLLNRAPTSVILWTWPIARILMCSIIYIASSTSSGELTSSNPLQLLFLSWLGWTAGTTLMAIVGQPHHPKLLQSILIGDASLTVAALILLRQAEGATIAFAICIAVVAMNIRLGRNLVFGAYAAGIFAFLLLHFALLVTGTGPATITATSELSKILHGALLLLGAVMIFIWGNRRYRLARFDRTFSSTRALSFEKSFEFDLQLWINTCASLFSPQKAACMIHAPAQQATNQYHHCNLPIWQEKQDRDELGEALRNLPVGSSVFDIEHSRIVYPDTGRSRPFDEMEQRVARILHRANVKAALVQPFQIDRARGGFICEVNSPVNPIIMAEASFIGRHATEMTEYLGKVARAQRNYIADAHDVARRDLHDGVLQSLAALRMRLLVLTKRDDVAKKPVELEIRKAIDIVTLEQSRLRGFLENNETANHTVNLVSQMDICVRTISLQWGIDVKLKSEEPAIPVDAESSFNIEHLLREVIANAVRHAKSKSLTVILSLKQDALMMAVTDQSQSLEGAQVFEKSVLTMKSASLRDRLRLVNGEAYAEGLGKGTLLSIRIPMQQIEND